MTQPRQSSLDRRFIADAAHHLRTPLAALQLQLELSLDAGLKQRQKAAVEHAIQAIGRVGHTLHQLLMLAQADAMRASGLATFDLDRIARDAVERTVALAITQGVDLDYAPPSAPVIVRGHPELLREAIVNLVDNALRYGASGGRVHVGVIAERREVYVRDEGAGIPAGELDNVRTRFYRVPGTAGEGCGLGLAIVDEVARQHSGRLILESGPCGKGVHARLGFPAT